MKPRIGSCLVILLLAVQTGLSAETNEVTATKSAQAWLALVDQGRYPESWDSAAKLFQGALTREKWKEALGGARMPLGKLISRSVKSAESRTTLPGAPDGKYVVIQFNASFENKKEAVETVTPMQESDGTWKVAGYFIK
jgi:hypothetical protein